MHLSAKQENKLTTNGQNNIHSLALWSECIDTCDELRLAVLLHLEMCQSNHQAGLSAAIEGVHVSGPLYIQQREL